MKTKFLATLLVLSLPAASGFSQPTGQQDPQKVLVENLQIIVEMDHIQLSFLVRDSRGNLIRNLSAQDFVLVENGEEKSILALKEQSLAISAVVAVDTSWSIGSHLENSVRTAVSFFKGLEKESSAFVLFSEKPRLILDWDQHTADPSGLLKDVKLDGKTALYDSVIWMANNLFEGRTGKKLIVLLSDGIDTISKSSFRDMARVTREVGVVLYPIICTNDVIENQRKKLQPASLVMNRPSTVSRYFRNFILLQNDFLDQSLRYGGRTIFSNNFADLKGIYQDIIEEMKSRYVMLYQSAARLPDDKREVKVFTRSVAGKIFIDMTR